MVAKVILNFNAIILVEKTCKSHPCNTSPELRGSVHHSIQIHEKFQSPQLCLYVPTLFSRHRVLENKIENKKLIAHKAQKVKVFRDPNDENNFSLHDMPFKLNSLLDHKEGKNVRNFCSALNLTDEEKLMRSVECLTYFFFAFLLDCFSFSSTKTKASFSSFTLSSNLYS